ncbi:hypothetical protein M408DRAFT_330482 [Serendipita vermifera MAFF 305830]|uniref:Small ribosomal subunit protein mS38 n=1 Tax=Serendipita vermifera MAFF 305830 TaxID=933852 RepID=A0A0C3B5J1_SERVB|nr:hypothetical protein M408DRAFT_330482 [Serendipita vermifera MAFF 305830]
MSLAGARARLASVPSTSTKRAYSILSKPGGGRFAIAAKVSKAIGTPGSSTTTTTTHTRSEGSDKASSKEILASKPQASSGDEQADRLTVTESKAKAATTTPSSSSDKNDSLSVSASTTTATRDSPSSQPSKPIIPALEPHPKPTKEAISLHNFFSLHRPLLLLPIHATQPLFTTPSLEGTIFEGIKSTRGSSESKITSSSHNDVADVRHDTVKEGARVPKVEVDLATGRPMAPMESSSLFQPAEDGIPEADADAARLLGRSYVLSRIGSVVDWQATLGRLGDSAAKQEMEGIKAVGVQAGLQAEADRVRMDSVKRKRKRKMNKHIYKKRRKRERAQRRRLGK